MGDLAAAAMAVPGPQPEGPTRAHPATPTGFEPGVRYERGVPVEVTTPPVPGEVEGFDWAAGIVPDGYRLVLREAKYDPAAWHRDQEYVTHPTTGKQHKAPAVTRPVWRYRFDVLPISAAVAADDLLAAIDRWRPGKATKPTGGRVFTVVYADMQIGKAEATGGTEATIERVLRLTADALAEYRTLVRRGEVADVALVFPGDGCEGFVSQGGRLAWRTDLTLTEMVRVYRRLVMHAVLEFAKHAPTVRVLATSGNHDQAVRHPVTTRPDDSWDVEAASVVADLCAARDDLAHVAFVFPRPDTDILTVDLAGTVVAVAHGHQFKGGAEKWWAGQAHGMQPAGEATLLLSGHFHHLVVQQTGSKTWLQAPALDNGSAWWTRETGQDAPAGLLTLVIGDGGWDRLRVLR